MSKHELILAQVKPVNGIPRLWIEGKQVEPIY